VHAGGSNIRAGVIICYDLRFPELTRMLALGGIQVLFIPARWPAIRNDAWQTLLKARAIENQIFVVGCNAPGKEGGLSYVFDPLGECLMTQARTWIKRFATWFWILTGCVRLTRCTGIYATQSCSGKSDFPLPDLPERTPPRRFK